MGDVIVTHTLLKALKLKQVVLSPEHWLWLFGRGYGCGVNHLGSTIPSMKAQEFVSQCCVCVCLNTRGPPIPLVSY